MSGQLRTLRNRIRSVENTKKITRAMEMVAAAKLRRFQDMMNKSRAYTNALEALLKKLSGGDFGDIHPFIKPREEKKIALVFITSDAGLCGSYNNDLFQLANKFVKEQKTLPILIGVGKSGITAFKKTLACRTSFTDIRASRVEEILSELRQTLEKMYLDGEVDAIYVVYSHFKNLTTYKSTVEKLLPLEAPKGDAKAADEARGYIFEPSPEALFKKLIPQFFEAKMRLIFLESIVSEQIARMTAMNQATKNAKEMIDSLVLQRNKARQASITKELIEIVSGSQALKLK
jgi:F-type H+-transporting ATPase subunit gamma